MKLTRGVSLMQQLLFVRLRERFIQYPIELGRLQSITIHNAQSEFTQGGTIITAYRASAHLTGKQKTDSVPPPTYRVMADIDDTLELQVFNVAQQ